MPTVLQCAAGVCHVQTVIVFVDDGQDAADHIPSSVSVVLVLVVVVVSIKIMVTMMTMCQI